MVLKILNNLKSVNRQALYPLVVMACAESPLTPSSMSLVCWWSSPYGYMFLVCWFASPYDYMFFFYLNVLLEIYQRYMSLYYDLLITFILHHIKELSYMLIIAIVESTSIFMILSISISVVLSSIDDDFPKRRILSRSLAKSWDVRGKPILNALPKLWLKTAFKHGTFTPLAFTYILYLFTFEHL